MYADKCSVIKMTRASTILSDSTIRNVYVDLGYRGVDADNPTVRINHRGKSKRHTEQERRLLKRRQAIEPIIGHLKGKRSINKGLVNGRYQ